MEREVSELHDSPREMQESWVEVGKEEGTAQESSSEEMTKLLADAVEEASGSKRQVQEGYQFCTEGAPRFMAGDEYGGMATKAARQEHGMGRREGGFSLQEIYSRLLRGLQDLLNYLTNPVLIASHLAAFGIGLYMGRRFMSS